MRKDLLAAALVLGIASAAQGQNFCFDPPPASGPNACLKGDPIDVINGTQVGRYTDISLPTTLGQFEFIRYYTSKERGWSFPNAGDPLLDASGVSAPFASYAVSNGSLRWWHNYFSFITVKANLWSARATDGSLHVYNACTGTASSPCVAHNV